MTYAPLARIILRYLVGAVIGLAQADKLAADPDLVTVLALIIGAAIEAIYALAKRKGWAT
jgi:hypothetical protein